VSEMRRLLYFLIVHNQTDLGSLKRELSMEGERRYGKREWENHLRGVEDEWNRVEEFINQYLIDHDIPVGKVRIYQDGLPVAGEVGSKIVREVARQGSRNYQILVNLIYQGACLEEAESRELLVQEHGHLTRIVKAKTPTEKLKHYILYQDISEDLLDRRDTYIANRINESLQEDELGLAFFGGTHSIVDKLDGDIDVTAPQEFNDPISIDLIRNAR